MEYVLFAVWLTFMLLLCLKVLYARKGLRKVLKAKK